MNSDEHISVSEPTKLSLDDPLPVSIDTHGNNSMVESYAALPLVYSDGSLNLDNICPEQPPTTCNTEEGRDLLFSFDHIKSSDNRAKYNLEIGLSLTPERRNSRNCEAATSGLILERLLEMVQGC